MRSLNLPDLTGRIILIVDDNDDALDMVGTFLGVCGAHVLPASTGFAALAYLDTEPRIDALVTDLSMPGMDGIELVRRLRAHPSGSDIPAIALTGFHEHYLDTSSFIAFLRKPADLDNLCKAIIEGIDQKHPHNERQKPSLDSDVSSSTTAWGDHFCSCGVTSTPHRHL